MLPDAHTSGDRPEEEPLPRVSTKRAVIENPARPNVHHLPLEVIHNPTGQPKPASPWRILERLGKPRKEFAGGKGPQGRARGSKRVQLARILWHLIKYQQPYDPGVWAATEAKLRQKKIKRLQQNASALGFQLLCTA